ncbi:MAG: Tryptophan synthase alpha chain [Labilithrix sp.]|nr:Tryptophan synthase alpha chain [Labilithrix sp.]
MGLHFRGLPGDRTVSLSALALVAGCLLAGLAACSSTSGDSPEDSATPNPNGKSEGADCSVGFDCRSGICTDGKCAPSAASLASNPTDGEQNGDETDIDCGGAKAPKCADGKKCEGAADCKNAICTAGKCVSPSPTDGVKNADETDVDCGGAKAPKCATGKSCAAHADCASDACSYDKKCVEFKGCTGKAGGDTCGEGDTGEASAKHENCCARVTVTDRPSGQGGSFSIDKYLVTAGRMRAFAERYQGNLKKWASESPKGWDTSLSGTLPENMDDVNILLGPAGKRGCNVTGQGGRTWSQPAVDGDTAEKSDFSQEVLDEKALNCVPWNMAAAVCAFDGGHLVNAAEMAWVYENRGRAGGATNYPWQWNDMSSYNPQNPDMRLVHRSSYSTPNPPAGMRLVNNQYPLDHAFWIAPPGRRPKGANMHGVQDAAGNVMPWVRDNQGSFVWTQSWEQHEKNLKITSWPQQFPASPDGYYAIGVRCTY